MLVRVRLGTPLRKLQQPNSKLQTPNFQKANPELLVINANEPRISEFEDWDLELFWNLDLGVWCLGSPCGVVQPTCLPLMQEITGAKPVRDANFSARGSRGIADPPDLGSGSLGRASRLAPTIFYAPKHCQRCICSVSRPAWCNSGWGAPFP